MIGKKSYQFVLVLDYPFHLSLNPSDELIAKRLTETNNENGLCLHSAKTFIESSINKHLNLKKERTNCFITVKPLFSCSAAPPPPLPTPTPPPPPPPKKSQMKWLQKTADKTYNENGSC